MIILDTDHFSVLKYDDSPQGALLRARMAASPDQDFAVTAITLDEQLRGWMAKIAGSLDEAKQVGAYRRLVELVRFFAAWKILAFDEDAAARSQALRKTRPRMGSMDRKIAAISLARDVLLLTANKRHFESVPGLRFEDWLH